MALSASDIKGFRCLPVRFDAPGKVINPDDQELTPCHHCFYFKEHVVRKPTEATPTGRTLFVLNIPLGGEATLEPFFSTFGAVQSINLQTMSTGSAKKQTLKTYDAAHVVFKSKATVAKVLKAEYNDKLRLKLVLPTGTRRFNQIYDDARQDRIQLKESIDQAVAAFDEGEARSKAAALAAAEPDEDGWTLVTAKTQVDVDSTADGAPPSKRPRRKKKKAEMSNFYRFQRLESHQEKLALLRKRFDEDKRRMELLKSSRKFKPY
eukprot:m.109650 g.109650  ORF g.109650 m.109650 type:complete len:264 (-) comp15349_c0_seq7:59-850(-)